MALVKKAVVLFVLVILFSLQVSYAAVYKVGDSAGWTIIGNIDYKQWAAVKTFKVGDIVRFVYNSQFHNVMQVTHPMYRACNASAPLASYATGNDSITITRKGHHYFLCGVPGHCQAGQKVDINVLRTIEMAPTPSALPPPPALSATKAPGPSSSKAASLTNLNFLMGLAMIVFAVFASSATLWGWL